MNARIVCLSLVVVVSGVLFEVSAQNTASAQTPPASAEAQAPQVKSPAAGPNTVSTGKPYTARIQIDTPTPVVYGEDVVVSVWISPTEGFDLKEVRIHPKGLLSTLYRDSDADGATDGTACRTSSVTARKAGIPFIAICRLEGTSTGLGRVFNWAAVLPSGGNQQFEVEVILHDSLEFVTNYYEFGAVNFVSPILSVIMGGILGAGIWTLFLPISTPFPTIPVETADGWKALLTRLQQALPQILLRWITFFIAVVRSVVLGGATALILIILARTTEGFETPIALQVKDLWGGLLVGIFSAPLSKWIRQKVEAVMAT